VRPTDLKRWLQDRPFAPFRIVMTDGVRYDIRHPDQVLPMFTIVEVLPLDRDKTQDIDDAVVGISYFHIVRLEPLPFSTPNQEANGSA
jgi:hypothetical protein